MSRPQSTFLTSIVLVPLLVGLALGQEEAKPPGPGPETANAGESGSRGIGSLIKKKVKKTFDKVAEPVHKATEPVHKVEKQVTDAARNEGKKAADFAHKEGKKAADFTHQEGKKAADFTHKEGGKLSKETHQKEALLIKKIKDSPGYKNLLEQHASLFMQSPHYIKVNAEKPGSPVYYINGILTKQREAVTEAKALSHHLNRPVWLIYNPTILEGSSGTPLHDDDVSEAYYDKLWPESLIGVAPDLLIPELSRPNPPFIQLNPTTKQITWVVYHAQGPISIVSQSQGCLQVRNALFTADLFATLLAKERTVRHDVAWVATGTPLNDAEIYPIPAKYHYEINTNDPVPAIIGFRGGPGDAEAIRKIKHASRVHEPIKNYFPRIQPSMLFP